MFVQGRESVSSLPSAPATPPVPSVTSPSKALQSNDGAAPPLPIRDQQPQAIYNKQQQRPSTPTTSGPQAPPPPPLNRRCSSTDQNPMTSSMTAATDSSTPNSANANAIANASASGSAGAMQRHSMHVNVHINNIVRSMQNSTAALEPLARIRRAQLEERIRVYAFQRDLLIACLMRSDRQSRAPMAARQFAKH